MSDAILAFVAGAVTMGFAVCGLYFMRFWRTTKDRLFLYFGLAFWLLGIAQTGITIGIGMEEERSWLYLLRLAAFILILFAIWQKNHRSARGDSG